MSQLVWVYIILGIGTFFASIYIIWEHKKEQKKVEQ